MNRNKEPSDVRLIQVDFAVVEPRSDIGWVFGTYMYDCEVNEKEVRGNPLWYNKNSELTIFPHR